MRRRVALTVVALHGLFIWLLVMGFGHRPREVPAPPQLVSLWIDPPQIEISPPPPPPPQTEPRRAPAPREPVTTQQQPAAPLAPPQPVAPAAPVQPVLVPTAPAALPTLPADWAEQSKLAARRAGEQLARAAGESFSEPPQGMAKPCVPKKRSMEWKGEENPGLHLQNGFPVWVVGNCTITIGFFACTSDVPPNGHLLDDMKDPKRSRSSVPDPKVCD